MIMEAILARDFTVGGSTTGASLTIAASGSSTLLPVLPVTGWLMASM